MTKLYLVIDSSNVMDQAIRDDRRRFSLLFRYSFNCSTDHSLVIIMLHILVVTCQKEYHIN